jgi:membrane protein YdbS with pleckstrin-like domain
MDDPSIAERPVDPPATSPGSTSPAPPAVRAQLLATEHWGLLASRSTTQTELLTRIAIFLTLVSAGLVGIGLLGQVTRFADWFPTAALAVLGLLSLVGLMTQVRVHNASEEDMMYVVAMNRLRGAYADLDPAVEKYFLASVHDDARGADVTYSFLRRRSVSHVLGSSAILIAVVTALVVGFFAGGVVGYASGSLALAIAAGAVAAVVEALAMAAYSGWAYSAAWRDHVPLRPTPDNPAHTGRGGRVERGGRRVQGVEGVEGVAQADLEP